MQRLLTLLFCCLFTFISTAQELTKLNNRFYKLEVSGPPSTDRLFKTHFFETGFHSLKQINCQEDVAGNQHCRYEISIFNIPLKGFHLTTHYNQRTQTTGYLIPRAIPKQSTIAKKGAQLSMQQALEVVKTTINATSYEQLAPSTSGTEAGLIYVPIDYNFEKPTWVLAYEIDVRSHEPLLSKRFTIDANDRHIIFQENRLCSFVPGTAVTRYHGTKTIETTASSGGFVLNDQTRGSGITTTNLNTGNLFFDDDNTWDNANAAMDEIAGDAHWGSAATFDFYNDFLGYNGVDGNGRGINSDVHLPDANAYWDGTTTLYGDGVPGGQYDQPFTYINIIAHEMTHAVTEFSSGLIYAGESGAMNESISDIIGMSVENQTNPGSVDWLLGQEASSQGNYFRNMANPKELQMADTYDGEYWFDGNGVHTNSSIGNYWFYLLVSGETDINDNDYAYDVTSIGWDKAYTIAHSTWTQYLSPSSTYEECALFSLEVAENLYGSCSMELTQVKNAWAAVGVLTTGSEQDFSASPRLLCELPGIVNFSASGDVLNPLWDFGDGNQSTESSPMHTYLQNGSYTITLSGEDCNNEPFTVVKSDFIIADDTSTACDTTIMTDGAVEMRNQCSGILVDDGGEGPYSNSVYSTLEIELPGTAGFEFNFDFFETESGYDYLSFFAFDGNSFVQVGSYAGILTGQSIVIESDRVQIVWDTDGSVTRPGFNISWNCIEPEIPVADFSISDTITCSGIVTLTDESTGPPNDWTWLVDGQIVSTEENPTIDLETPGSYDIGLIACNSEGCDSISFENLVVFDPTLTSCQVIVLEDGLVETTTLCQGTLVDDGGVDNEYSNSVDAILDISTLGAVGYEIEFVSFNSESGYDELQLFVDNGNGFEFFAEYEGILNPFNVTVTGTQIRFIWNTDGSVTRPGFEINWTCLNPTTPPIANFELTTSDPCSNEISLTDESTGFPNSWSWWLDDQLVATNQDPTFTVLPGTYDLTLIACNDIGCDTSTVADLITYDPSLPACQVIVMTDELMASSSLCEGTLVDDGGVDNDYSNSVDATLDIAAPGAMGYLIELISFNSESGFDELQLFVDNGNGFEFFAEYEGSLTPFNISVPSAQIRFVWNTDGSVTRSGFEIAWTCLQAGIPVADFSNTNPNSCSNITQLLDNSLNFPDTWTWLLDGTVVSTEQNPLIDLGTIGTFDLGLIACNNFGCDTLSIPDYLTYDPSQTACSEIVLIDEVQQFSSLCSGQFSDDGGPDDYADNVDASLEISPPGAAGFQIEIPNLESSFGDTLFLYVNNGNGFVLYDLFTGHNQPIFLEFPGTQIRFVWQTNDFVTDTGFEVFWNCLSPSVPLTNFELLTPGPCNSEIQLTDLTEGFPNSWTWLLDEDVVSTEQHPFFTVEPGTYDLSLIACNDLGCDTSTVMDLITYDPTLSECQVINMVNNLNLTTDLCEGTVVDDGGLNENYNNNIFSEVTVATPGAFAYQISFDFFETESSFDYLSIYVDDGNGFEFIEAYDGILTGESIFISGNQIRFEWDTDGSVTRPGFAVSWACVIDGVAPLVNPTMDLEDCENIVHLSANSPNADQVMWNFGDGNTGQGLDVSHTYATTGTFEITATAMNASGSTPFSMSVSPDYNPVYFVAPDNMMLNESQAISIISPPENLIQTISWELNGNYVTNNYSHSISFNQLGTYELKVTITDLDGCVSDLIEVIEVGTVGTTDLADTNIRIHPNPTKDLIHLLDLQSLNLGYSLSLVNTIGQQVYEHTPAPDTEQLTIDMSGFPAGVYYLNIISPDQRYQGERIIKIE